MKAVQVNYFDGIWIWCHNIQITSSIITSHHKNLRYAIYGCELLCNYSHV